MPHPVAAVLLLVLLAGPAVAEAAVLIDTEFGGATEPVTEQGGQPNPRVTGVMAGEWHDNSIWSENVEANWEAIEEEGRSFLRLNATKVTPDRYQLSHALPRAEGETFYRLTLTARSMSEIPIQIGVRDRGQPYEFHWSQSVALSASWRDFAHDFRAEKIDSDIGFWINTSSEGSVDLMRLKLVSLSRDDYIDELKARYPNGGPKNLLRTSSFPLGLQQGWTLGRDNSDGDDVVLSPDTDAIGPSGQPALKIAADEKTVIWGAPFSVPLAFQPHTASIHTKGSGDVTLTVFREGQHIAANRVTATDGWQRLSVKFDPALMAQSYTLRIEGTETYWIDAVQVSPGDEPIGFQPQMASEVHLAIQPSDASAALVQFEDETPLVHLLAVGDAADDGLRARVLNVYGDQRDLGRFESRPTRAIQVGAFGNYHVVPTATPLDYAVFPDWPFGPHRIEAWVEDNDGNRISPYNEIVINRLPRPKYWGKDAPDSPFGVHTLSTTRHNLMAKAVGANWTRLHDAGLTYLGWYHLEQEQGEWTFHDKEINRYRRDHIKILGELGTAPEWASYHPGKNHNGYFDRYYQPRRMEDYANYVRTVTERYKGVIDAYDVWNEPWIWAWWGVGFDETKGDRAGYITSENPQADFTRLMQTAFETAKSVDPGITILGFNSTSSPGWGNSMGGAEWTKGVLDSGGLDYCAAICYHEYIGGKPGYPGDVITTGFETATGAIREKLGELPKPVWMTEGSAGRDTIGPGFYNHTLPYENPEDVVETSDRLARYVMRLLAQGCSRMFLYSMHAQSFLGAGQSWSVIVTPEGQLHPSGVAHGIAAWHLEDTEFVTETEVTEGVTAYIFEAKDGSRSVACISAGPDAGEWTPPTDGKLTVTDLFGNPVAAGEPAGKTLVYISLEGPANELESAIR